MTVTVTNTNEFVESIRSAERGDHIKVAPHTLLDLSEYRPGDFNRLAHDLKITAGTGMADRPAATIRYDPDERVSGMLMKTWRNINVSGFRIFGPEPRPIEYDENYELGFLWGLGDKMTVGGNYLHGWPFAPFAAGAKNYETELTYRNSVVRNCWMGGYGYGVEQYNGHALYHNVDFDQCRHAIAAFGWPTCSYEVRQCRFGPNFTSHAVDMHRASESAGAKSLREKNTQEQDAGGDIHIHHCDFELTHDYNENPQEAIAIRGVPTGEALIEHNRFAHPTPPTNPSDYVKSGAAAGGGEAVRQQGVSEWTNVELRDNEYDVRFPVPREDGVETRVVEKEIEKIVEVYPDTAIARLEVDVGEKTLTGDMSLTDATGGD